jgi:hypothetical protein
MQLEALDKQELRHGDRQKVQKVRTDPGLTETGSKNFEVALSAEGWLQAADSVVPFCEGSVGYQWLAPQSRGIQWLFSKDGSW